MNGNAAGTQGNPLDGLVKRIQLQAERLSEIRSHAGHIADTVYGPVPEKAEGGSVNGGREISVSKLFQVSESLDLLDREIDRIRYEVSDRLAPLGA